MPSPRTGRDHAFVSRWSVAAPREACWAVLAAPELSWPRWWPGLRGSVLALTDDDARLGSRAALAFRTPFGRRLRLELEAVAVEPPSSARFAVAGDLVGVGVVTLADDGPSATVVVVRWDVRTARWWLDPLGPWSRPLAAWSHARVMRAGEHGLAGALRDAGAAGPGVVVSRGESSSSARS
ncbi:hypothetical protein [Luteimicrobium sp. DT211]|uniref:hypothetical protein n=1 Tax=Luteimicrobium sp. DT211 TaxID=3393412 RepID=UPI003CF4E9AA